MNGTKFIDIDSAEISESNVEKPDKETKDNGKKKSWSKELSNAEQAAQEAELAAKRLGDTAEKFRSLFTPRLASLGRSQKRKAEE